MAVVLLDAAGRSLPGDSVQGLTAPAKETDEYLCRWDSCGQNFQTGEELYNHLCTDHVIRRPKHYGAVAAAVGDGVRVATLPRAHNTNAGIALAAPDDSSRLYCHWKNCSVTVQKRDHMTSHIRIHINMKPYSCPQCEKKFKRTQDLKKHLRTHPEDKAKAKTKLSAVVAAAAPRSATVLNRRAPVVMRAAKRRKPGEQLKESAKRACREVQQLQLHDLRKYRGMLTSDPEKQRAVTASLTLLADVHSSQVKPEFSESLAERLDTISLILKDEKLLQHVSETVSNSNINTSEQLGELNEFLEQVTESITEQQEFMRMKQEEQPLSELVYTSMKPVFPPLPFEPGTEADFLSGPHYFTDVFDPAPQHFQEHRSLRHRRTQNTATLAPERRDPAGAEPNEYVHNINAVSNHAASGPSHAAIAQGPSHAELQPLDGMFKDTSSYWGNAPLLEAPEAGEEHETSDALDYYLNQMETQMTAEHTLEVTSGLRTLISDAMEPDMREQQCQTAEQYTYPKQTSCQPEDYHNHHYHHQEQRFVGAHYSYPGHSDAVPNHQHLAHHPGVYNDYRADMRF